MSIARLIHSDNNYRVGYGNINHQHNTVFTQLRSNFVKYPKLQGQPTYSVAQSGNNGAIASAISGGTTGQSNAGNYAAIVSGPILCTIQNCAVCDNEGLCADCLPGYRVYNGYCQACSTLNCISCTEDDICTKCTIGFTLDYNNQCTSLVSNINAIQQAPSVATSNYINQGQATGYQASVCQDSNCISCDTTGRYCKSCVSGYMAIGGACADLEAGPDLIVIVPDIEENESNTPTPLVYSSAANAGGSFQGSSGYTTSGNTQNVYTPNAIVAAPSANAGYASNANQYSSNVNPASSSQSASGYTSYGQGQTNNAPNTNIGYASNANVGLLSQGTSDYISSPSAIVISPAAQQSYNALPLTSLNTIGSSQGSSGYASYGQGQNNYSPSAIVTAPSASTGYASNGNVGISSQGANGYISSPNAIVVSPAVQQGYGSIPLTASNAAGSSQSSSGYTSYGQAQNAYIPSAIVTSPSTTGYSSNTGVSSQGTSSYIVSPNAVVISPTIEESYASVPLTSSNTAGSSQSASGYTSYGQANYVPSAVVTAPSASTGYGSNANVGVSTQGASSYTSSPSAIVVSPAIQESYTTIPLTSSGATSSSQSANRYASLGQTQSTYTPSTIIAVPSAIITAPSTNEYSSNSAAAVSTQGTSAYISSPSAVVVSPAIEESYTSTPLSNANGIYSSIDSTGITSVTGGMVSQITPTSIYSSMPGMTSHIGY